MVLDAGREAPRQPLHHPEYLVGGLERIRARPLEDADRQRDILPQIAVDRVVLRAKLDATDIAHPDQATVFGGANDDLLELLRRRQPPLSLHL